jgi:hypothetical protein
MALPSITPAKPLAPATAPAQPSPPAQPKLGEIPTPEPIIPPAVGSKLAPEMDTPQRLRHSVWAVPNDVMARGTQTLGKSYRNLAKVVDDVSLQMTFCNKADMSGCRWDPLFLPGGPKREKPDDPDPADQERIDWLTQVVKLLQEGSSIQVLAGYKLIDPGKPPKEPDSNAADYAAKKRQYNLDKALFDANKANFDAFNKLLNAAITNASALGQKKEAAEPGKEAKKEDPKIDTSKIEKFADELVKFFKANCSTCDGISFDIEGIFPIASSSLDHQKALGLAATEFYRFVASKIEPKIVAVAAGALVDDVIAFNNYKDGVLSGRTQAFASAIAHPYEMALGHPNLIVRPMMYDGQPLHKSKTEAMLQWERDMLDYALSKAGGKGIPSANFQVGIKTISKGGTGLGNITSPATVDEVARICRTHEVAGSGRPAMVGLIYFPYVEAMGSFKGHNAALNPGAPEAGGDGTPLQAPRPMAP